MGFFSDISAGSILSAATDIWGKKQTQAPAYAPYQSPDPPAAVKTDNTMILVAGGGILAVMMMFMFMKK